MKMDLKNLIPARLRKDKVVIPVVRLSGAIMAGGSVLRPPLSLANVANTLKRAFSYKRAPVIVLSINSPGGSPVQSRLIHSRIRELAKKHKKKVLVFVEDVAASGGYMIALAGDEIIADATSIVGSIGVVSAGFGFDQAISKLGVDRRVYTAGENKVILYHFQPEKEKDIAYLKSLQGEIHQIFIDMVKDSRGTKLADNDDLFSGLFWTGAKAKELGLIDGVGLMAPVIRERYGDKAELKLVQPKRGLFGRPQPGIAVGALATGLDDGLRSAGLGLAAGLPDALLDTVAERALWARYGL
ncbi:MAG: S49 family peptidase [Salaquimonas sp.]|nr:S49 family peptidase [Salaquimonas sp.]